MDTFVNALKSVAEPTRLRILNILLNQELTVSEITDILNYSQPRISRHLKLMCDAGVLLRVQEGSWVFYRVSTNELSGKLARSIAKMIPHHDDIIQR
jgi:transcriptional regulator, ArsR family